MKNSDLLIHDLCTQGYHIIDGLLEQEACHLLRVAAQELYEQGLFRGAKIGLNIEAQKNSTIRTDEILWLEGNETNPAIQVFLAQMQQLAQLLNQTLFLGLNEFETHFASYQPGTYYKKHVDQFAHQKTRKVSFVYYLNPNWLDEYGGELKLYDQNDQLIQSVTPQENRFICFKSDILHEVTLTHQPRYSITGWMKTRSTSAIMQ